ncbi:MAG: prepilin-type cleavage/methylation domain-containing protein [Verrucomicrobiota bacterium]|nr:prepilin-type cleavage/methylation domain-containing protein [Verrucomicrobiota bacterium]MDQ6938569.1 prepilin-type cleavage/methylation domain-containing protein [Verrucomicrobiota bacterium]
MARARKRTQATDVLNSLRLIDAAVSQYAVETNKAGGAPVQHIDYKPYLQKRNALYHSGTDIFGNTFGIQYVDQLPNVPGATEASLSDVTDAAFWSPYQ